MLTGCLLLDDVIQVLVRTIRSVLEGICVAASYVGFALHILELMRETSGLGGLDENRTGTACRLHGDEDMQQVDWDSQMAVAENPSLAVLRASHLIARVVDDDINHHLLDHDPNHKSRETRKVALGLGPEIMRDKNTYWTIIFTLLRRLWAFSKGIGLPLAVSILGCQIIKYLLKWQIRTKIQNRIKTTSALHRIFG